MVRSMVRQGLHLREGPCWEGEVHAGRSLLGLGGGRSLFDVPKNLTLLGRLSSEV